MYWHWQTDGVFGLLHEDVQIQALEFLVILLGQQPKCVASSKNMVIGLMVYACLHVCLSSSSPGYSCLSVIVLGGMWKDFHFHGLYFVARDLRGNNFTSVTLSQFSQFSARLQHL